jgi:orotidine-5'-phosphate decarboxylase
MFSRLAHKELHEVGVDIEPMVQVQRLGRLAQDCGLDGLVCSARESKALRGALGSELLLVTPGIRSVDVNADDQKRVVTPRQAMSDGSSYLVIGRPITRANSSALALDSILAELQE